MYRASTRRCKCSSGGRGSTGQSVPLNPRSNRPSVRRSVGPPGEEGGGAASLASVPPGAGGAPRAETEILAFRQAEDRLELVLQENPFYAESGGQVSDTGVVRGEGWELPVEAVLKVDNKQG